MRVLDPTTRNPFHKLVHKVTQVIGVAGATFTTGAVTIGGPAAAGLFMAPEYFMAGAISIPAFMAYGAYKGRVKENARLDIAYTFRRKIRSDFYPEVDAVIEEVFKCPEKHEKYQAKKITNHIDEYKSLGGRSRYSKEQIDEESRAVERKRAHEHVLELGSNCEYCGTRLQAIELLCVDTKTEADKIVDNSRLENLLEVAAQHRLANEAYNEVLSKKSAYDEVKELTSGR